MADSESLVLEVATELLGLPQDLLVNVLNRLQCHRALANAANTCRRLAEIVLQDGQDGTSVWAILCCQTYLLTSPASWIAAAARLNSASAEIDRQRRGTAGPLEPAPTSFRGLYRLLSFLEHKIGYWRGVGDAPRGSLFKLSWGKDCLELHQLQCSDQSELMRMSLLLRLGPAYPLHVADLVGDTHLVIRQFRGEHRTPCAAAAAAADVAVSSGSKALMPRRSAAATVGGPGTTQRQPSGAAVFVREDAHPAHIMSAREVVGRANAAAAVLTATSPAQGAWAAPQTGAASSPSPNPRSMPPAAPALPAAYTGASGSAGRGVGAGGFGAEVLKFMASQVAPPRGAARRRQKAEARSAAASPGGSSSQEMYDASEPMSWSPAAQDSGDLGAAPLGQGSGGLAGPSLPQGTTGPVDVEMMANTGASNMLTAQRDSTVQGVGAGASTAGAGAGVAGPSGMAALLMTHGAGGPPLLYTQSIHTSAGVGTGASTSTGQTLLSLDKAMGSGEGSLGQLHTTAGVTMMGLPEVAEPLAVTAGGAGRRRGSSVGLCGVLPAPQQLVPVGPAIQTHHFVRLRPSMPTRAHPLAGLWKGVYGPHGLEIISVSYDFSGSQARVNAWKVTGDHNVPASEDTWWASAAPMGLPWSEHELHLQEARLWLSDLAPAQPVWLGAPPPAGVAAAAAPVQAGPGGAAPGGMVPGGGLAMAAAGAGPGAGPLSEMRPQLPKILSSHVGCGRIAGLHYSNPQWVPGRLWLYDNGNMAFLFCWPGSEEEPMFMVDYTRVP